MDSSSSKGYTKNTAADHTGNDEVFGVAAPDAKGASDETAQGELEDMDPAEKQALLMAYMIRMPLPVIRAQLGARWLMLFLLCMALIGSYYCYDNPTAIHNQVCVGYSWKSGSLANIYLSLRCSWPCGTEFQRMPPIMTQRLLLSTTNTICCTVCIHFPTPYVIRPEMKQ